MRYLKRGFAVLLAAGLVFPAAFAQQRARTINSHNSIHTPMRTRLEKLNALVDLNSTKNQVRAFNWMNRITIGGIVNVDFVEEQRGWNVTGPSTAGIIPNFRLNDIRAQRATDITINNANLLVDATVNSWVKVHLGGVYRDIPGPIEAFGGIDEAYITVGDFRRSPFYVRMGRVYVPIGTYEDPYPLTTSFTQLMTQTNATVLQLGYVSPCGVYGTVYGFNSPFSGEVIFSNGVDESYGYFEKDHLARASRVRNFGAKFGYKSYYRGYKYNLEASILRDFRDTSFFLANERDGLAAQAVGLATERGFQRAAVYELHGYVTHGPFDLLVDYAALTRRLDDSEAAKAPHPDDRNSRMWAYGVRGGYWFNTYKCKSKVQLGYERAGHSVFTAAFDTDGIDIGGVSRLNPARYTPRFRYVVDYIVKLGRNVALTLQYTYSKDYRVVAPDLPGDNASLLARSSASTLKGRFSVAF